MEDIHKYLISDTKSELCNHNIKIFSCYSYTDNDMYNKYNGTKWIEVEKKLYSILFNISIINLNDALDFRKKSKYNKFITLYGTETNKIVFNFPIDYVKLLSRKLKIEQLKNKIKNGQHNCIKS